MVNMNPREAWFKCKNEKKRIPELEDVIATDPQYSYWYACDIIKGRFEKGEKIISTNSWYSYYYSIDVIKGPFELCYPVIFSSPFKDEFIDFLKSINHDLNEISEWLI